MLLHRDTVVHRLVARSIAISRSVRRLRRRPGVLGSRAVEAQAIDRAHRIGQTRHVIASRLIARDTVEEKILELQAQKRDLADAILTGDAGLLRQLTREDLELLLA